MPLLLRPLMNVRRGRNSRPTRVLPIMRVVLYTDGVEVGGAEISLRHLAGHLDPELDVAIQVRRSAQLADALPNATYRSLPGRAHLPPWRPRP